MAVRDGNKKPRSLRSVREEMRLTAADLAERADCPVEVVLRAEFGMSVPVGDELRVRLAGAYELDPREYLSLALDAAERSV